MKKKFLLILLFIFLLRLVVIELIVLDFDVDSHEDELITEISHAFYAVYTTLGISYASSLVASGG